MVECVAAHLGKDITEEQMNKVLDHLQFKQFVASEAASEEIRELGILNEGGKFFRKGMFPNQNSL